MQILLLRRQLGPITDERVTDLVQIRAWRSKVSKILPKEKVSLIQKYYSCEIWCCTHLYTGCIIELYKK